MYYTVIYLCLGIYWGKRGQYGQFAGRPLKEIQSNSHRKMVMVMVKLGLEIKRTLTHVLYCNISVFRYLPAKEGAVPGSLYARTEIQGVQGGHDPLKSFNNFCRIFLIVLVS